MTEQKDSAYKRAGVNYDSLDPFKRFCLELASRTEQFSTHPFSCISETRGESAFGFNILQLPGELSEKINSIFHVEEGLGTKNLIADAMQKVTGRKHYHHSIAKDAVAMIVNDLITQGVSLLGLAMHLAVGDSTWFEDTERYEYLANGWYEACCDSKIVWTGGETPALKGVVCPETYLLSGSAVGYSTNNMRKPSADKIQPGDSIIIFESSGVHANGLTLCRKIADKLPDGYLTVLPDHRTYGEALLEPTIIYARLMEAIHSVCDIHYAVNITGHGWRKFMRPKRNFEYVLTELPKPNTLFDFIIEKAGISSMKEAYETFNMGAGFAIYVAKEDVPRVLSVAHKIGISAFEAGYVSESDAPKVTINPLGVQYDSLFH